jgi:hypothetical protein
VAEPFAGAEPLPVAEPFAEDAEPAGAIAVPLMSSMEMPRKADNLAQGASRGGPSSFGSSSAGARSFRNHT